MEFSFTSILCYCMAFVLLVLAVLFVYFKHCFKHWERNGIPCIEPMFPFGNMQVFLNKSKQFGEIYMDWYGIMKAKGARHFGVFFFNRPFYVPVEIDLIKRILTSDFQHFYDRGAYCNEEDDPLSAHLFSLKGLKWKHLRNKISPTFTSGKMKKMFQTLIDCSDDLKNCLNEPVSKSEPVDIRTVLANYTIDVIGSCAFGIDCNSFKNPNNEFARVGKKVFQMEFLERIKAFFIVAYPGLAASMHLKITNSEVESFYTSIVNETINFREKNNVIRNDFMQLLIQLKNKGYVEHEDDDQHVDSESSKLTFNEIAAQAFLFFVAGYETSSTTMSFTLYSLALNSEIQQKAREEIINVLKRHDGNITYEAINEMHYLERVVQESQRLHPAIPMLQRECTKEYKIPNSDFTLKPGEIVVIPTMGLHYDPEYYPEPEKFDPERFTEEAKATRPDYAYLPFGEGPRVCLGLRFGMMEVKVGLCRLLQNYKFTLNSKTEQPLKYDTESFILTAKGGIWLDVERT